MRKTLLVLATLLSVTACGSTVQVRGSLSGTATDQGLGTSDSPVTGSTPQSVPTSQTGTTTGTPADHSAGSAPTVSSPDVTATDLGRPLPVSTAITSKSAVTLGIRIPNASSGAVVGNLTGSTLDIGDPKAMAQAVVSWVNAHGGLGGRRVQPLFYENCAPLSCDLTAQDQQICAYFTQDHKAIAMVDGTETSVQLASCLAKRGVASLGGGVASLDDQDYATAKGLWSPYLLSTNAAFTQLIARLQATGWFVAGEKLGLLVNDTPTFRRTAALVKKQMSALGKSFVDEEYYAISGSGMSGAVLKFKSNGVKRIVIVDAGSSALLQFAPAASSQGYYPKVTVTSADVMGTIALIASPKSLDGAAGVGWLPDADAAPNRPAPTSAGKLCAQIYQQARVKTSGPLAGAFAAAYCDGVMFAKAAYDHAPTTGLDSVRSAIAGLGTGYVPSSTFSSRFGNGRYAGAASTRDVRYDTGCSCFRYSSGPVAVR